MTLGEQLRAYRRERGLTQLDLGGLCGIHNVTISEYERGARLPSFEDVIVLATELGANPHELVTRMVKERLLKTEAGRIALAEFREGRFYDE